MKKFLKNTFFYIIIAIIILIPLAIAFQDVFPIISIIGNGSILAGIILTPFVVIGIVNVFRGFGAVLQIDEVKYGNKIGKGWNFYAYLLINLGGYFALFYALIKCL